MNPTPWKAVRHNPVNVTVEDANGVALATAHQFPPYCDSMETAQLIAEAVNGRAALRDIVRRFADNLRRRHILGERDNALLKEARAVLGDGAL